MMAPTKAVIYKSECGQYLCRPIDGAGAYEAWLKDGSIHWKHDDRVKTWADAEKPRRPFRYGVGAFSAQQTGQKKGSFTLYLVQCNTRMRIKPFTGNTVIEDLEVVFRRRVPAQNYPIWLRAKFAEPERKGGGGR